MVIPQEIIKGLEENPYSQKVLDYLVVESGFNSKTGFEPEKSIDQRSLFEKEVKQKLDIEENYQITDALEWLEKNRAIRRKDIKTSNDPNGYCIHIFANAPTYASEEGVKYFLELRDKEVN